MAAAKKYILVSPYSVECEGTKADVESYLNGLDDGRYIVYEVVGGEKEVEQKTVYTFE